MIHQLTRDIENLHGRLSCERQPILTIASGDEVSAQTRCCGWGVGPPADFEAPIKTIKLAERSDPEHDSGICLVGPIALKDARPDMTLEVEILELQVGGYGITVTGGSPHERYRRLGFDEAFAFLRWRFDTARGVAYTSAGFTVQLRPFLGCLGVAKNAPGYHSNLVAGQGGGNIDCRELVAGSKLYLPIQVPGALFSFGDGHAAQGDGEVGDSAIECPMDLVRLRLTLRDDLPLRWPIANTPAGWVTFGFHEDLTEATFMALNGMLDLMVSQLGITRKEAALLAGVVVDLRISQIVNPTVGVHAVWPHGSLSR